MVVGSYILSSSWLLPMRIILSLIFSLVVHLRNKFYDWGIFTVHKVSASVISVGNLSSGGTGKTVLVQTLLTYFRAHHLKAAVLSRGYARHSTGLFLVSDGKTLFGSVADSGDEPYLIARNYPEIPIVVSADRVVGAQYLTDHFLPDLIILDDGFQHRRLHRDLDIVIIDTPESVKEHLLPWGTLREGTSSLVRAHGVVYSKTGLRDDADIDLKINTSEQAYNARGEKKPLSSLTGRYGIFAGIGKPQSFFASIETILGPAASIIVFADHTNYGAAERKAITAESCDFWITTEKDFVKLDNPFCLEQNIHFTKVSAPVPASLERLLKNHFNL